MGCGVRFRALLSGGKGRIPGSLHSFLPIFPIGVCILNERQIKPKPCKSGLPLSAARLLNMQASIEGRVIPGVRFAMGSNFCILCSFSLR